MSAKRDVKQGHSAGRSISKRYIVFYLGNIRWYIMEGQQEGSDYTLYGIVAGLHETESGYLSANEMAAITYDVSKYGLGTLRIE